MSDISNPTPPPAQPRSEPKKEEPQEETPVDQSRWDRDATDDNALDPENEAYVGVSPEYQNFADVGSEPMLSEDKDQKKVEQAANERYEELKVEVQPTNPALPYVPDTVHPSEKKKPQDKYVEASQKSVDKVLED